MKGGIFALSETFIKILTTAAFALVLFAVFFALNNYYLIYVENKADRETLVVGNIVLSSCIAENPNNFTIKGLLSEDKVKLQPTNRNLDCLANLNRPIYIEIYDRTIRLYGIGDSRACKTVPPCVKNDTTTFTVFPAALNRSSFGPIPIIPVTVKIFLGV